MTEVEQERTTGWRRWFAPTGQPPALGARPLLVCGLVLGGVFGAALPEIRGAVLAARQPCRLRPRRVWRKTLLVQLVDRERDDEPERRHHAGEVAAVLEGLRHHRVGQHRQDRARGEREDERHDILRRALEERVARE